MSLVTNRLGFVMVGLVVAKDVVLVVKHSKVKEERRKRLKRTAMATTRDIALLSTMYYEYVFSFVATRVSCIVFLYYIETQIF